MTKQFFKTLPHVNDLHSVCTNVLPCLETFRDKHILITGGTGFIGKWLIETLLYANNVYNFNIEISVQTRNSNLFVQSMPHLFGVPSLNFIDVELAKIDLVQINKVDVIVHAANLPLDKQTDFAFRHSSFVLESTVALQRFAKSHGVQRVLLTSSGAAYERCQCTSGTEKMRETECCAEEVLSASKVYGLSKRFLEMAWTAFGTAHSMHVSLARCFTFIGPYMPLQNGQAAGSFMAKALSGEALDITGDGKSVRSYMYASDLMIWLLTVLCMGRHGTPYNVGSDQPVSILELAEGIAALQNPPLDVHVAGKTNTGLAPQCYVPDTSRSAGELGLSCKISFQNMLEKTFAWYKTNNILS